MGKALFFKQDGDFLQESPPICLQSSYTKRPHFETRFFSKEGAPPHIGRWTQSYGVQPRMFDALVELVWPRTRLSIVVFAMFILAVLLYRRMFLLHLPRTEARPGQSNTCDCSSAVELCSG